MGYDIGATAAVLEELAVHFDLSTFQKEMVPSSMVIGAILAVPLVG